MNIFKYCILLLIVPIYIFTGCKNSGQKEVQSETALLKYDSLLISNEANQWFARALADVNKDGLLDVVFINQAGFGGELGVLMGSREGVWEIDWIAEKAPNEGTFSCGDIEVGDIDGDGKLDILAPQNNGEWTDKPKEHTFYWYTYPEKEAFYIGKSEMYIKDVDLVDLNNDGKLDLTGISFDGSYLIIYEQIAPEEWNVAQKIEADGIHEGMDVGDLDGDGFMDIAANGYWVKNPSGDMKGNWKIQPIDSIWYTQSGDWSRNATKHFCADMDKDGKSEVFITHSERAGYPVAYYSLIDTENNTWEKKIVLDSLAAAHTLQVYDMDNDGDLDVVTGINKNRAINIDIHIWPVYVLINEGNGNWKKHLIDNNGIYNGHVGDFEGDGDLDIFRLISHDDKKFELLVNQLKQP
jgi:hypothetical protein